MLLNIAREGVYKNRWIHIDWFRVGEAGATHGGAGRTGTRNVGVLFSWIHVVKTCTVSQGREQIQVHSSKEWHGLEIGPVQNVGRCKVEKL